MAGAGGAPSDDPLASEIARWQTFLATHQSSGEIWKQVQESTRSNLADASEALANGRRALALQKLVSVRVNLSAMEYLDTRPPSELDAAGLRDGALYKYLQAAQRLPVVRNGADVPGRLAALEKRLDECPVDSSIGQLYLEIARADLAAAAPDRPATAAAAIADDVLPRYFAALAVGTRPSPTPRPPAEVTVTLVRWPYT